MAADAAVLVALRHQNSFSHRSLDGGGPLDRCADASDMRHTSAALRPNMPRCRFCSPPWRIAL
eukprot:3046943-Prymnesium_polylepis.1